MTVRVSIGFVELHEPPKRWTRYLDDEAVHCTICGASLSVFAPGDIAREQQMLADAMREHESECPAPPTGDGLPSSPELSSSPSRSSRRPPER